MAQTVKHLSTMQETWVPSLGREDPLEKEIAIHSRTIAWKIPWTEEPGRVHRVAKSRTQLSDFTFTQQRTVKNYLCPDTVSGLGDTKIEKTLTFQEAYSTGEEADKQTKNYYTGL